jgi:hypothetical protein
MTELETLEEVAPDVLKTVYRQYQGLKYQKACQNAGVPPNILCTMGYPTLTWIWRSTKGTVLGYISYNVSEDWRVSSKDTTLLFEAEEYTLIQKYCGLMN